MMRRLRSRGTVIPAAALAVGLVFGLSACAGSSENTAAAMHDSVVQIAERAAAGDYAGALAELALLERDVATAAENGTIDAARETEITDAIEVVRADLESAEVATTPTPEPTVAPSDNGDDGGDDDSNKGPGNNNGNKGKDKGPDD
jgi:hypothetical protein